MQKDTRHTSSIPKSGRSPAGGNGNPLQYTCLENPVNRGAWRATVHPVTKNWTWLTTHKHHHLYVRQRLKNLKKNREEKATGRKRGGREERHDVWFRRKFQKYLGGFPDGPVFGGLPCNARSAGSVSAQELRSHMLQSNSAHGWACTLWMPCAATRESMGGNERSHMTQGRSYVPWLRPDAAKQINNCKKLWLKAVVKNRSIIQITDV